MRVLARKTDTRIDINQNRYQFPFKKFARCGKSSYLCSVERVKLSRLSMKFKEQKIFFDLF